MVNCYLCREVEDELEIVWQSATSENDRMKTVLQKTMKKLRQHEQLSAAMDQQEPKKIVYVSSDGEADWWGEGYAGTKQYVLILPQIYYVPMFLQIYSVRKSAQETGKTDNIEILFYKAFITLQEKK